MKNNLMRTFVILPLLLLLVGWTGVRTVVARFPIGEASAENLHDGLVGRWKFEEDSNRNNFYEVIRSKPYALDRYHLKFWDRGGKNPTYESNLHFSKLGDALFINVPYFERNFTRKGFFFLKVLDTNSDFTRITAALVGDVTLWEQSEVGVRKRIEANMNNPSYFADTIHLYKVQ